MLARDAPLPVETHWLLPFQSFLAVANGEAIARALERETEGVRYARLNGNVVLCVGRHKVSLRHERNGTSGLESSMCGQSMNSIDVDSTVGVR